jgi:purine-nucleoside phosphorylase
MGSHMEEPTFPPLPLSFFSSLAGSTFLFLFPFTIECGLSMKPIHIRASEGDIAETVLLPGDPHRAKLIADTLLVDATCYNSTRGALGFTGTFHGHRVSVQSTGMGCPSAVIYATELVKFYGVKTLIRVGTCGAMMESIELGDLILAMGASYDSAVVHQVLPYTMSFTPVADFGLLKAAQSAAERVSVTSHVGTVLTTDTFYWDETLPQLTEYGILAVEMETAGIYTVAAKYSAQGVRALSVLTVSDHVIKKQAMEADQRENCFANMVEIALDAAFQ